MIQKAILISMLIVFYPKDHTPHLPYFVRSSTLAMGRVIYTMFRKNGIYTVLIVGFAWFLNELPFALLALVLLTLLSLNHLQLFSFVFLLGLALINPLLGLIGTPFLIRPLKLPFKDHSELLSFFAFALNLYALFPLLMQFDFIQAFPLNRLIMLIQFVFSAQFASDLLNAKETATRLKTRFHLVQLRFTSFSLRFLPEATLKMLKRYSLGMAVLLSVSLLNTKTLVDHLNVLGLTVLMLVFELDLLYYHHFQVQPSLYHYTLVRKGVELLTHYLSSSYIILFGLFEGMRLTPFLLPYFFLTLALLFFFHRRRANAQRIKASLLCFLLLSGCASASPATFVIETQDTDFFAKVEAKLVFEAVGIQPAFSGNRSVSKGTYIYRDGFGTRIYAPQDGTVEQRPNELRFVSNASHVVLQLSELDLHFFRMNEAYPLETLMGDALGAITLTEIDHQVYENQGLYDSMNHYLLYFELEKSDLHAQSVIIKVPQPTIVVPQQFVFPEAQTLYIQTDDGLLAVEGDYEEETNTYHINTRLQKGLILYEFKAD